MGIRMDDRGAGGADVNTTEWVIDRVRSYQFSSLPTDVIFLAKQCMLDWFGVTLAGSREPVARILREELKTQGGVPQSTLVGTGEKVTVQQACLVNGAASHALDYDDVLQTMLGHPSSTVFPVVLALGERERSSGQAVLAAFVAGVEAESLVGRTVEPGHHNRGWHTTGTLGTFGAVVAASHLLSLDRRQWLHAFGIAGTQASGLKAMFGTMCKPFHAGAAAANGFLAASLAGRGMTSETNILDAERGFAAVATDTFDPRVLATLGDADYDIRQILFKYHASCYLTHSAIEGVLAIKRQRGIVASQVRRIGITVGPTHVTTCTTNFPSLPLDSLQAKFSLPFLASLAFLSGGLGEEDFTEAAMRDPEIFDLARRVEVTVSHSLEDLMSTPVVIETSDGELLRACVNVGQAAAADNLAAQWSRLLKKFMSLAVPVIGYLAAEQLAYQVMQVEDLMDISELLVGMDFEGRNR